jgi:predicted DNA-binding WGR domain protein
MLKEYDNDYIERYSAGKIIERYDLHFKDSRSDKVYICVLLESESSDPIYMAVTFHGRRGTGLARSFVDQGKDLAPVHKAMVKKMNEKVKKGYKEVGRYTDDKRKASANGALDSDVIALLRETYPIDSIVVSPTGNMAKVFNVADNGSLFIVKEAENRTTEIPFGKYGSLKVISD